uniref:Pre-mRNA-splicing factor ISY1 n=1 Tax=Tetraselmis sp. GSL018 TaxID=582737 RepID=A0A061S332_9CHLO|mmetsp:Transcript_29327/g.69920  ORF Transcript_29327/g.69920 Transcript_29327/m.69920 type:complete len:278 (+) Transcript_29327:272-1105(+)
MARNEEKANAMLNRFLAAKGAEGKEPKKKRPYLASECKDLNEADQWRQQILREIGRKVMEIQNSGLGEHRLRDLNDEINKLIREKGHWERRIVALGGPNYAASGPKIADSEGNIIPDATGKGPGYRYFGAAKQLPGVKELFEKEKPRQIRRTRHDMYRHIDADYYGFRDDEDGVLAELEERAEKKMRTEALEEWEAEQRGRGAESEAAAPEGPAEAGGEAAADERGGQFVAYVPLPDTKAIEQRILDKKKADLLSKYTSETLLEEQAEAKELLNKRA